MQPSVPTRRDFVQLALLASLPLPRNVLGQRPPSGLGVSINPRDLGATGDGRTKDTVALQQALDRCAALGGGEVLLPPGDYLTGTLRLHGRTRLHVSAGARLLGSPDLADYPLTQVRWEGRWIKGYSALLSAEDADDITLEGKGSIVASPLIRGRVIHADGSPVVYGRRSQAPAQQAQNPDNALAREQVLRLPALMEFMRCRRLLLQDLVTEGNGMWSTHPVLCQDAVFRNLVVHSGADGIDVDSCERVLIEGCDFSTRDDCISLKSGRGLEGNTLAVPCQQITIRNCTFRDAVWAAIGIGSETSGGVRDVTITDCRCLLAKTFAIYIKTRPGRGAFVENISVRGFDASGTGGGFLRINTLNSGLQDPEPVPGEAGLPKVRSLRFSAIRVQDVPVLVDASAVDPRRPIEGFFLEDVTGTCARGMLLANIHDADLRDIHVTGYTGPLLSTSNVTGKGLQGSTPLPPVAAPTAIPPRAEPYVLR